MGHGFGTRIQDADAADTAGSALQRLRRKKIMFSEASQDMARAQITDPADERRKVSTSAAVCSMT